MTAHQEETDPTRDSRVVEAFRAGDDAALADLYARWSPLVYSLALRSTGDVARAEHVTQRVFTRAWEVREDADPDPTRFATRLVALALAELRGSEAPRKGPRTPSAPTPVEDSAPSESKTGVLAERLLVADGMSQLDTLSQRVLQMALDHDLTLAEIGERTGLRADEVRSTITSCLTDLRHRLEGRADAH